MLVFGRSLGSSIPMHCSLLLSVIWGRRLCFPFPLSFVSVVHLPLLVGWCFSFSGFLPLHILLGFPVVVLLWDFLPLLSLSLLFLGFFSVSGRSSASVKSPVPSATGSSLWAESVAYWVFCAPSRSLVLSMPFGVSTLVAFCFSPSPSPVVVLSTGGSFLLGAPCYSSSVGFLSWVRSQYLLWFSLAVFYIGPSALFSASTSFQRFLSGVVLIWWPLPSFLYVLALPVVAGRYISSVCSL